MEELENQRYLATKRLLADVRMLSSEVQSLYLTEKWKYDEDGNLRKTPEIRAKDTCLTIRDKPELYDEIVLSLRQQQTHLSIEIDKRKQKLSKLSIISKCSK